MSYFLDQIRPLVQERVNTLPTYYPQISDTTRSLTNKLQSKGPHIIAEIKFARPGHGCIYTGRLSPVEIAEQYLSSGASALSIITEPHFFNGQVEFIAEIRTQYPDCFILMKDFILDERQILQAKQFGADAILLIAAFLSPKKLKTLYHYALSLQLTPLIEVHKIQELDTVLPLNPPLIGINHRNLHTLQVEMHMTPTLIQHIPSTTTIIAESGIRSGTTVHQLFQQGVQGFLIGSLLMQEKNPGLALQQLIQEIHSC